MVARLPLLLVFAFAVDAGGVALAQDRPGECVARRVTGPGGAYRWDRVECEARLGGSDFDRWGYDRRPLNVVDGPLQGDRYGGWRPARGPGYSAYDDPNYEARPRRDDRYDAPYPTYRVAGRDADGYLVWPGKLP
jgi:hypothetical protein